MSDIQLYLFEADRDKKEATRIATQTAQRLEKKELKLVDLIQSLGQCLNHDETAIRTKTISYLAEVLTALPPRTMSRQNRDLLCDFMITRIADDTEGLGSCAKALLALETQGQWDQKKALGVLNTLLEYTHPLAQCKLQSERYLVLKLFDLLMAKYREALNTAHTKSPEFMPRFVSYFDGEKDPRNLMIAFSILKVPMTEWAIASDAQDLFEAVFNYFPITFRPPPDDPYGITSQDLKDRLRDCITASADFAPYAFPALLDKLDSTSINTKRDVLQALTGCALNYGPRTVSLYSITLWDALKFEILHVQEEDLAEEALRCLAGISAQLSKGTPGSLTAYLKPIAKECNEHLEDAPTKQSQAAGQILNVVCSASPKAANFLLRAVLPNIFTLYQATDDVTKRRGLLEALNQLLDASLTSFGEWRTLEVGGTHTPDSIGPKPTNAWVDYVDQTLQVLIAGIETVVVKEVSYRMLLLKALLGLAKIKSLLPDVSISKIIKAFDEIIIKEESYGKDELKAAAIGGLVEIAHQKPHLIVEQSFPAFMAELPDVDSDGNFTYIAVLEAFAKLGSEPKVFDTVILRLKNKLNAAMAQQASTPYLQAILSAILYAFVHHPVDNEGRTNYLQDIVIPLLSQAADQTTLYSKLHNDMTFDLIGRITNVILRTAPLESQREISKELYILYQSIPIADLPPFNCKASAGSNRSMILSTHLLASLRRDALPPYEMQELVTSLTKFSMIGSLSAKARAAALRQLSLVVNKFITTSDLASTLKPVLEEPPYSLLSPNSLSNDSIKTTFAVLKGLVLRNAPLLSRMFTSLLSALSDTEHGIVVSRGFSTLLQPDDLLNRENHCVVTTLHKQKTFSLLVPEISSSFRTADAITKRHYLIALSGLLHWLPYTIIEPELASLAPLLLQTLDLDGEDNVKGDTVDTLISILAQNPKVVEEHASSLIMRLLNVATAKTPPRIRTKTLQCLALVPTQLRPDIVLPFRKQVVKRLIRALDDRKRTVRTEAVRCRAKWIELDEAGDDED